jgi:hypothetical protein
MENNIISVGIFFDGTGNNGMNATSHKNHLKITKAITVILPISINYLSCLKVMRKNM